MVAAPTEVTEAPKKEITLYESKRCLRRLLKEVVFQDAHYPTIIKTASELGWFTNGTFITRLNPAEQKIFKKIAKTMPECKHEWSFPVSKLLNQTKGPELTLVASFPRKLTFPFTPSLVKMQDKFNEVMFIRTWEYITLKERHPDCEWHMTGWNDAEEDPIILTNGNSIFAMVCPCNVKT